MKVLITGGGTGGHTFPVVALARTLLADGHDIMWMGRDQGLEYQVAQQESFPYLGLSVSGVPRRPDLKIIRALWQTVCAGWQARTVLAREQIDVVVAYGSYVCMPALIAARYDGIPMVLHEGNGIAGWALRFAWSEAAHIFVTGLPTLYMPKSAVEPEVLELPVREEALPRTEPTSYAKFGLDPSCFTLMVFGGSQGANAISETALALAHTTVSSDKFQILLVTGKHGYAWANEQSWPSHVKFVEFVDDMGAAYGCADLVVCRSGMLTLAELAMGRVPAILIPFPFATENHQQLNAERWLKKHDGVLLLQSDLSPQSLLTHVHAFYTQWNAGNLPKLGADPLWQQAAHRTIEVLHQIVHHKRGEETYAA